MSRKTYRIEIKIDFSDDDRHTQMTEVALETARGLLAAASLLADGRKPVVALITDDSFVGTEQIELRGE